MPAVMTTTTTTATTATANCRRALSSRAAPARVARVVAVAGVRLPPRSARARAAVVVRAAAADGGGDAPGAAPSLSVDDIPAKKPPSEPEEVPRPPLRVAAALAAIGSLESSYLAFEKLTGGEARSMHWSPYDPVGVVTCPLTGCQTALNSGWATLFGLPLSAYGAVAYGMTAALCWWGAGMADGGDEMKDSYQKARVLAFFAGTGLAGVSSYLLYVLAVPLGGAECVYCLTSAAISFTVFSIALGGLSSKDFARAAPPGVALYAVTVFALSLVLTGGPEKQNINDLKLPYAAPIIETVSTQYSRDVADWLAKSGAKMYGAFWCSHCEDQKETFGKGAAIPYVECFPNGWEKGTPIADACKAAKVDGFPTWVLGDGTVISGEKSVDELAKASGYEGPRGAPPAGLDADAMLADFLN